MKYIHVLIILLIGGCTNSQPPKYPYVDADSIEKYTYLFVGIRTIDTAKRIFPIGSCFFIKRGSDLFLITAKHNISGFNTFNRKPTEQQFDTIGFKYYNSNTKQVSFSSLDAIGVKKMISNELFYHSPDVIVLKMKDPLVEKFIVPLDISKNDTRNYSDSVISYGYAVKNPKEFDLNNPPTLYKGKLMPYNMRDPFYPINDSFYYVTEPTSIQGMSGAPVFTLSGNNAVFGGVLFGGNASFNSAYIVPATIIINEIIKGHF